MKRKLPKTPRDFATQAELCAMPRDNLSVGNFWILVGNHGTSIVLCEQKKGESAKASIEMPRATFIKFVDWFNTGKVTR